MSGIAVSIMSNSHNHNGENEFAEMEYVNITVITSNKPYGIGTYDGSNPNFDGKIVPKFNLKVGGIHSGHVQRGLRDPLCYVKDGKGKCMVITSFFVLFAGLCFEIYIFKICFSLYDNLLSKTA